MYEGGYKEKEKSMKKFEKKAGKQANKKAHQTSKQVNEQTTKQTDKQASTQTEKQAHKQTSKYARNRDKFIHNMSCKRQPTRDLIERMLHPGAHIRVVCEQCMPISVLCKMTIMCQEKTSKSI